ncbi:hypothetical protein D9611_003765 [Ephemerocybe angulata]|uniref:Uncharacterized protein n=1 Tax=Ephemerocybe angulata TaxID=980116 RepID=A0A8H5B5R6_9AGAR|nr:hypothetical protein D9611_003765 [Tulosesus angulatus]
MRAQLTEVQRTSAPPLSRRLSSDLEDSTPSQRGRPFRDILNTTFDPDGLEFCLYMVVRREKFNQAVGRIVFLPSPTPSPTKC